MCDVQVSSMFDLKNNLSAAYRFVEQGSDFAVLVYDGRSPKRGPFWISTERPSFVPPELDDTAYIQQRQAERISATTSLAGKAGSAGRPRDSHGRLVATRKAVSDD
jgi:hypothetical protein